MHIAIDDVVSIFKICVSILFMGNVKFSGSPDSESEVDPSSERWIKKFIKVLNIKGMDEKAFKKVITSFERKVGNISEDYPRKTQEAKYVLDSFCKKL